MRSLHVIGTKIGGGAENFLVRLVGALAERGHPTHVAARPGSPVVGLLEGVAPVTPVPMRNGVDILSARKIRKLAARTHADIVQTYMGRASRLSRFHGRRPVHVARLGNYYRLASYRHCDAWIGNTRGICDYLVDGGFPADRVFHIYNFVDVVPPDPNGSRTLRAELGLPHDALVLLAAGRFTPVKGFDLLLRAFAQLPSSVEGRPTRLVLVGDGPASDELHRLAVELRLGGRVCWTGWQNDASPYFGLADVVVFPARKNEPFGNVVLEAWAHARPLVTTDFVGAAEYVSADNDAVVVPCAHAEALGDALAALLGDERRRRSLAEAGLVRIRETFSVERVVSRYLEVYDELTGGGP